MDDTQTVSFYEAVGGEPTFRRLVHRFYEEVAADPELRPVYPSRDLGPAEEHLRLFLMQYWGGPATYNELRGHPRLRMRHVHFRIGEAERDAWLRHMRTALDELDLDPALDKELWDYLVMAAHSLVNQPTEPARRIRPGPDSGLNCLRPAWLWFDRCRASSSRLNWLVRPALHPGNCASAADSGRRPECEQVPRWRLGDRGDRLGCG